MNAENNNEVTSEQKSKKNKGRTVLRFYTFVTQIIMTFVVLPFAAWFLGSEVKGSGKNTPMYFMIGGLILAFILNILFIIQFLRNEARYDKYVKKK